MKARTPPDTYKRIHEEVAREFEDNYEELYKKMAGDITAQNLAVVFWTMETRFGWKKKRLLDLVEALHDTDYMMCNPSRLHHRFSPLDCEKEIKEKFGIDLREEFKAEVEVKP